MPNFNSAENSSHISRRAFAERLALAAAAPLLLPSLTLAGGEVFAETGAAQQAAEPSALAKALAEGIRLRYGDRLSADDLAIITRGIDGRLRGVDRLYQVALANGDEPDFVFRAYRGPA
ncbi:MAG TPA: hypothetical protein VI139_03695 [Gemmatimonadales bacterium]